MLLLQAKADVNAVARGITTGGGTALQAAAENGYKEIVRLLLESGAHVHSAAMGDEGRTALREQQGVGMGRLPCCY
jgi:ankyrin repeat protein